MKNIFENAKRKTKNAFMIGTGTLVIGGVVASEEVKGQGNVNDTNNQKEIPYSYSKKKEKEVYNIAKETGITETIKDESYLEAGAGVVRVPLPSDIYAYYFDRNLVSKYIFSEEEGFTLGDYLSAHPEKIDRNFLNWVMLSNGKTIQIIDLNMNFPDKEPCWHTQVIVNSGNYPEGIIVFAHKGVKINYTYPEEHNRNSDNIGITSDYNPYDYNNETEKVPTHGVVTAKPGDNPKKYPAFRVLERKSYVDLMGGKYTNFQPEKIKEINDRVIDLIREGLLSYGPNGNNLIIPNGYVHILYDTPGVRWVFEYHSKNPEAGKTDKIFKLKE